MPQLDTSTWLITIMSMIITLFIVFQLKISTHLYPVNPEPKLTMKLNQPNPWEKMNENLFASFITPTMMGLPIVVLIIMLGHNKG